MLDYKAELLRLCALAPTELWLLYPERIKYTEKVVVDFEKANDEPMLVHTQFINYLQIPVRKPWVVTFLCKHILLALAPKGSDFDVDKVGATPRTERNEQHEPFIVPTGFDTNRSAVPAYGVNVDNFDDPLAWQADVRADRDINLTSDDVLLEIL